MNNIAKNAGLESRHNHVSRKEDYKSYVERDEEEGWPYSDEPAREEDKLRGNREYGHDEALPADAAEGFHIETAEPLPVEGPEADETVERYIEDVEPEDGKGGK